MITLSNGTYKKFYYPCGEMQVRFESYDPDRPVGITFKFDCNEEILELLFLVDALKREKVDIRWIQIPYMPYSRQDRVCTRGDSFSLKVLVDLLNNLQIPIYTCDPHSDVMYALFNDLHVITQDDIFFPQMQMEEPFWLISPDGGALKKVYKLAERVKPKDVIVCNKIRNATTGEITGVQVAADNLLGLDCYIVDDICDGGRTFIEIARVLKTKNCGKIILMVTHGFFTKGLKVFDGLIDEIYTREGKVIK